MRPHARAPQLPRDNPSGRERSATHWPGSPAVGMPQERLARLAARRAFVEMKHSFLAAASLLDDTPEGAWLQRQVRRADAPEQLWLLRDALFAALGDPIDRDGRIRKELRRTLDTVFPGLPPQRLPASDAAQPPR